MLSLQIREGKKTRRGTENKGFDEEIKIREGNLGEHIGFDEEIKTSISRVVPMGFKGWTK